MRRRSKRPRTARSPSVSIGWRCCGRDPARLPWRSLDVDIVFECTGAFTRREDLDAHIRAGARYVILSAPSKSDDVETIVHGVNTPAGAHGHHLVRELHDELHHTGDGDSRDGGSASRRPP